MITLIIVDDNPIVLEKYKKKIKWNEFGCELIGTFSNGQETLDYLSFPGNELPQIVLTDIVMPKVDGLKLSEEIKKKYPDICIIIITSHQKFEYAFNAIKIQVNDYIIKPCENSDMHKAIKKAIEANGIIDRKPYDDIDICKALIYMEEHYSNKVITINDVVTNVVYYNAAYFSKKFKKVTGKNFIEVLNEIRIKKAKKILIETTESITNIAMATGFSDSNYFSSFFKKITKLSPTDFRKKFKQKPRITD